MIEKLNKKIRPLLEICDKLKDVLDLAKIKIPIIATCGMQSHGKSSTLESITKIELPSKAETCTICPIKICLMELDEGEPFYDIKLNNGEKKDENNKQFKKLKNKIDEYQEYVKKNFILPKQNENDKKITITKDIIIEVIVHKKNVPNLILYDLPGVTFTEGIKEEAEEIYDKYLDNEDTTVLLILNGGDDLSNSCVIEYMKKVQNYENRFIPVVARADLIENFNAKFEQLQSFGLNTKPCLIINKVKDNNNLKNLSDKDEVKKIKKIIPKIEEFPVNIGRKQLIDQLIKIQYEKYKENFRDIEKKINDEITKNKNELEKLPPDIDIKEDFCDSFIDIFEQLLDQFYEDIKQYKKGPKGDLLKYIIHQQYEEVIKTSKEKVNGFLTINFCNYVTNNIKQTNSDKITILEDETPFKRLIKPKITEILETFEEKIKDIYKCIKEKIETSINNCFSKFMNLKNKVNKIYDDYSKSNYQNMKKFYNEICLLETSNITSFDLELNYKCHVIVRKILNFLYKKGDNDNIIQNDEEKKEVIIDDTSDNIINDERDKIIKGEKDINKLMIKTFQKSTGDIIDELTKEVEGNSNYKQIVKDKYKEYKNDIKQIVGIINNYEIEQLTRIYDGIGCKGRPKLSYNPENVTTFDERIEDSIVNNKDDNEFIPGFQFIKNKNLNDFINFFKKGEVLQTTANTIVKMVAYAEVMCNRVIDTLFLSIQKYLYDNLTNEDMVNYLRNEVHKDLIILDFEQCKKLLEVNKNVAEEIKKCKDNISKLSSSLIEIDEAFKKFYEKDDNNIEENKNDDDNNNNEDIDDNNNNYIKKNNKNNNDSDSQDD